VAGRKSIAGAAVAGVLLIGSVLLWLVSRSSMRISVENATAPPTALADVVVRVRGDEARVGTIPQGERRTVHLHPHGKSGILLGFTINGEPRTTGEKFYVDSDNFVADFSVRGRGELFGRVCISALGEGCVAQPLDRISSRTADAGSGAR
jgi:hypothetical protein